MRLIVTVDIDNDGVSTGDERNRLSWLAVDMVPKVCEQFAKCGMRATWFVRADWQLFEVYGAFDFLLSEHHAQWQLCSDAGDEIAWHAHLYRRDGPTWVPERDGAAAAVQLRRIHAALHERFRVVRIGEAFGASKLTATMEDLGLRVDSSALPGRRRDDASRSFDWSGSPNRPYRPSVADFRTPGRPSRMLWQVPMTTAQIRAPHEEAPVRRYLNLAYRPEIFKSALDAWRKEDVLVTILHPDELLPHDRPHPLYAFDIAALSINLAELAGLGAESLTMTELADQLDKEEP